MAYNFHQHGVSPEWFEKDQGLKDKVDLIAKMTDIETDDTFAAAIEYKEYPFFGLGFHPEKITQMHNEYNYNQSWESFLAHRHIADVLISYARENTQSLGDFSQVQQLIIENSSMLVTDSFLGAGYTL